MSTTEDSTVQPSTRLCAQFYLYIKFLLYIVIYFNNYRIMFATTANNGGSAILPLIVIQPYLASNSHIGTLYIIFLQSFIDSNSIELYFISINSRMLVIFRDIFSHRELVVAARTRAGLAQPTSMVGNFKQHSQHLPSSAAIYSSIKHNYILFKLLGWTECHVYDIMRHRPTHTSEIVTIVFYLFIRLVFNIVCSFPIQVLLPLFQPHST